MHASINGYNYVAVGPLGVAWIQLAGHGTIYFDDVFNELYTAQISTNAFSGNVDRCSPPVVTVYNETIKITYDTGPGTNVPKVRSSIMVIGKINI